MMGDAVTLGSPAPGKGLAPGAPVLPDAIGVFRPQQWGTGLILLAAALTLWSMFYYLKMAMPTVLRHG